MQPSSGSIHLPSSFRSQASDRSGTSCGPISRRFFQSSSAAGRTMRWRQPSTELKPGERGESEDDGGQ